MTWGGGVPVGETFRRCAVLVRQAGEREAIGAGHRANGSGGIRRTAAQPRSDGNVLHQTKPAGERQAEPAAHGLGGLVHEIACR